MNTVIGISTLTADPFGSHVLYPNAQRSRLYDMRRRVSRAATLDAGAVMIDSGYTDADRTVTVDLSNEDADTIQSLRYLLQSHDTVRLFLPDGAYLATLESMTESNGAAVLTILISGYA